MAGGRWMLVALLACATLANGAKRGPGVCKNCIKNQVDHHNQRLIASPINLLNPDRYEFFTLDDKGKVVKRIMTFKEIQSIVAGSDNGALKLMANGNNNNRIVSSVVSNVRNVLNNELNSMHSQDSSDHHVAAELPISEMITDEDEPAGSSVEYAQDNDKSAEQESMEVSTEKVAVKTTPKPTEQTTPERLTVQSTESTTKRWTSKATTRPTTGTTKLEMEGTTERRTTTIRPTISSTERAPTMPSTLRPTEGSTVRTTTLLAKVEPTTKPPMVRSTTEEPKVRSTTPVPTTPKTTEQTTVRATTRSTTRSTTSTTERSTTERTTAQPVKLATDRRSTTTTTTTTTTVRPSEEPILKFAERSSTTTTTTTTVKPTEKLQPTEATTTRATPTEKPVVKASDKPLLARPVEVSTEKSSEQSGDYSTLRSEEASTGSSMEYSTEESSEKGYEESSEATAVKSSVGSTVGLKTSVASTDTSTKGVVTSAAIVSTTESVKVSTTVATKPSVSPSTPAPTKFTVQSSTTKTPLRPSLEAYEALKDLVGMVMDNDSESSEEIASTPASSTLYNDPIAQYVTMAQVPAGVGADKTITTSNSQPTTLVDLPEVTTLEAIALEETIPTSTSSEMDATTMEDSTGDGGEESEELQQSTDVISDPETTVNANGVTFGPLQTDSDLSLGTTLLDSSTIPSDAQHAIHKIIESLQSINEDSVSDESDSEMMEENSYPMDVPGLNYDTDAQSSINAIIQSLGQGSLVSGENSLLAGTTEILTTTEEVPTTTTARAPEKTSARPPSTTTTPATAPTKLTTTTTLRTTSTIAPTTSKLELKTSAPVASSSTDSSFGSLNYNTNIMDTIEKFLSKFANLPNEESYSANLTKINILSDYPAEINMTDYVDRTATVASVLKFPQTKPTKPDDEGSSKIEVKQREDPPGRPQQSLTAQSLLNETVASFMKLGEMLTMGNNMVNTVDPPEGAQMEVKTAVDEEETELLRFLSICGNLGTNVYDYLTGPSVEESLEGRSLVYSPFATITTLSMLFLGTRGTTAESINGVIGLDEMTSFNPHLFFKSIADDLKPKQRRTAVGDVDQQSGSFFSRTLLSDSTRGGLQRFFKARIQEIYSAVAETVDFHQKDTLLKHMNGDFPRDYVDTLKQLHSPLVSISRNRYRHECNDATTYGVMNFRQSPGRAGASIAVPSVTFRSGFSTGFSNALDATILSLPGANSNVSVFFLKPSTPTGLAELETHIRTQSVAAVLKLFPDDTVRTAYAEVELPYFTQTTMYNMSRSIQQLGLQNLFKPNVANFNGLQDSVVSNLYLSETIQTDSFALCGSEDGIGRALPFRSYSTNLVKPIPSDHSLASALSDKQVRRNRRKHLNRYRSQDGAPRAQDSSLMFDAPFLYLVRHNPTGLVLYMGRFVGNNLDK